MRGRQAARKQRELAETGLGRRGAAGLNGCWRDSTCQAAIRILRATADLAFIEVASPTAAVFEALIDDSANDPRAARLAKQLLDLRELTDLGPAVYMDLAKYLRQRIALADVEDGQLVFEAFYSYLLPQFEGIDAVRGQRLFDLVGGRLESDERRERLRRTLNAVLGLEL